MFRVLLVEDDNRLAKLISEYLSTYEFSIEIATRGDTALAAFKEWQPDLVILDLMLPGLDGMVVCRQIREISNVLILVLTAREDVFDHVSALEQGADDYINKPIQPRILLAHLRALLRRKTKNNYSLNDVITIGQLMLNKHTREVHWHAELMELSSSEYKLLQVLVDNAGHVLSRDDLLKKVRGIEFDGLDRSIDNNISRLRKKFDDDKAEKIKTIWGEGYLFNPAVWN